MSLSIIGMVFASFASPVAVNRILEYIFVFLFKLQLDLNHFLSSLETKGRNDYIRPWFWVVCLFFGPLIVSICFQWYIYLGTRTLARTQGILTELVFEHSLRIRFKAESSGGEGRTPSPSTAATPAPASETGSVESETAGGSDGQSDGQSSIAHSESSAAAKGKGKEESAKEAKKKDNLIGKINTLVTVDVDNITNAKDILMLGQYCIHLAYVIC